MSECKFEANGFDDTMQPISQKEMVEDSFQLILKQMQQDEQDNKKLIAKNMDQTNTLKRRLKLSF